MPGHEAHIRTLADHPEAIIPDTIARNTGVDSRIATHAGIAAAHHAVHVGTLADHPDAIIPATIARTAGVDSSINARAISGTAVGRPAHGVSGRYYIATDTRMLSLDIGTAWLDIANIVGTEVDSRISSHAGIAAAHHAVHVGTLADHPEAIIPAAIARTAGVDSSIASHTAIATAHHAIDAMIIVNQVAEPIVPAGAFRVWHNPGTTPTPPAPITPPRRWLVLGTDGTVAGNRKVEIT